MLRKIFSRVLIACGVLVASALNMQQAEAAEPFQEYRIPLEIVAYPPFQRQEFLDYAAFIMNQYRFATPLDLLLVARHEADIYEAQCEIIEMHNILDGK